MLMPQALTAVISLSAESLPKTSSVAVSMLMGIVNASAEGIPLAKILTIGCQSIPLETSSDSLNKPPIENTKVKTATVAVNVTRKLCEI
jgi:hypothetical protein